MQRPLAMQKRLGDELISLEEIATLCEQHAATTTSTNLPLQRGTLVRNSS